MYSLTGRKDALKCIPQQGLMLRLRKYIGVAIFYRGTKSLTKYAKQNAKRARQNAKNALAKCEDYKAKYEDAQPKSCSLGFPRGSLRILLGFSESFLWGSYRVVLVLICQNKAPILGRCRVDVRSM